MSSMVLSGDTSGAVTISAPAVAGTTTATLQAVTGTLALQSDGVGFSQTWQNVAGSRVLGTTYTNSTGKPIAVSVQVQSTTNGTNTIVVAGVTAAQTTTQANLGTSLFSSTISSNIEFIYKRPFKYSRGLTLTSY